MAQATVKGERIAKRMAAAGLCSRREAERWIEAGRVSVDGEVLKSPAHNVTAKSLILIDGKPLAETGPTRLWLYHKPAGLITTHRDPQGRSTVFEKLPASLPRVVSVGRLDLNSEGLLLLTTDGELARKLEHPDTGWTRRYRVRIHGRPQPGEFAKLENGVTVEGVRYGQIKVDLDRQQGANAWLSVGLAEGKNREIRKVLKHLGYDVNRLIRTAYGPFQLGNLKSREVKEVPGKVIREQLGEGGKPAGKGRASRSKSREAVARRERSKATKRPPKKEPRRGKARS